MPINPRAGLHTLALLASKKHKPTPARQTPASAQGNETVEQTLLQTDLEEIYYLPANQT